MLFSPSGQHEFDALKNSEVNYFRWKMKNVIEEVQRQRQSKSWLDRLYYQFPPRINQTPMAPMNSNLKNDSLRVQFKFYNNEVRVLILMNLSVMFLFYLQYNIPVFLLVSLNV